MGAFEHFPYTNFQDLNLDWIIKEMKELLKRVDSLENLEAELKDLFDNVNDRLVKVEADITALNNLYINFKNQIENDFAALTLEFENNFDVLRSELTARVDEIAREVEEELEAQDIKINALSDHIDEVLANLPNEIVMLNPFTGTDDTLYNIINMLADAQRENSLTALEYDTLALAAATYDGKGLTAFEYDWNAKNLLP